VLHLASVGSTKTDDYSYVTTVHKRHAIKNFGFWSKRNHAHFVVIDPLIHPYPSSVPVKLCGHGQRNTMLELVTRIFGRIELDTHILM
jgi:hypothetical protein